jgi:prolyl-tRNA synthetase
VILPIYRSDDERALVMAYCESLKAEIAAQQYDGAPVRVKIDDRDLRGGEKTWQHIKRGVPLRLEIGPRDVAAGAVFVGRRDQSPKDKSGVPRGELVAKIPAILAELQDGLFSRALAMRESVTRKIDDLAEFVAFFTPQNEENPEIHGGLALCHFSEGPEMDAQLKALKTTIRCLPLDAPSETGSCIFTGRPSTRRGVFAKAY